MGTGEVQHRQIYRQSIMTRRQIVYLDTRTDRQLYRYQNRKDRHYTDVQIQTIQTHKQTDSFIDGLFRHIDRQTVSQIDNLDTETDRQLYRYQNRKDRHYTVLQIDYLDTQTDRQLYRQTIQTHKQIDSCTD